MTTNEEVSADAWLEETCLDRLLDASTGLSEVVLCATVIHRAPPEIGGVVASDVKKALKRLQESGRVAVSAGRWRRLR